MAIPVWRVVADDAGGDDWTLVAGGPVKLPDEPSSAGSAIDCNCMWNAEIGRLILDEFSGFEENQFTHNKGTRTNCLPAGKENYGQNVSSVGLLANKNADKHPEIFSPRKRGILTENSALCNGSEATPKRQRLYPSPHKKHDDVQPMFQTASLKPLHVSNAAMQKARSLLGFDAMDQQTICGQEESMTSITDVQGACMVGEMCEDYNLGPATRGNLPTLIKTTPSKPVQILSAGMQKAMALLHPVDVRPLTACGEEPLSLIKGPRKVANKQKMPVNSENDNIAASSITNIVVPSASLDPTAGLKSVPISLNNEVQTSVPNSSSSPLKGEGHIFSSDVHPLETMDGHVEEPTEEASSCLFQTATGKGVSISTSGMLRARQLFANTDSSNLSHNSSIHMFQTARGESVSVSSIAIKQAKQLLGEQNASFSAERSLPSPPIKFVTAVGKSISVSSSAMKRAKDLLGGDLENTEIRTPTAFVSGIQHDKQQLFETAKGHIIRVSSDSIERAKLLLKDGTLNTSVTASTLQHQHSDFSSGKTTTDFREVPSRNVLKAWGNHSVQESSLTSGSKKVALPRKVIASFKAPRRLQTPTCTASSSHCKEGPIETVKHSFSELLNLHSSHKKRKSNISLKDFFREQPHEGNETSRQLTNDVKIMTSETAKNYRFSSTIAGLKSVGSDEFRLMLLETGANSHVVNKEWVDNHFRWIVWKLASLERSYPTKVANKLLTVQRVFDELKYRYEREVDDAHRSAIKRICEGDSMAGRMMILCVAAVCSREQTENNLLSERSTLSGDPRAAKIEVTDGWYSLIALLDPPLIRQLKAGKVFVGQKLRVCKATLFGCTTPMPPLEAFQVMKLGLHMNGTFRAGWMEKLGFCRGKPMPLAFHCIKPDGGLVPRTIIGIHRIYPVLFCERLPDGGSITRSARAEDLAVRGYHDRRFQVAEGAIMQMERECKPLVLENEMDEGLKIFRLLEDSAEPELLMAEMSAAQHAALAAFQMKREAARQSLARKNILKALGEVHLDSREVTPFVKISVTGLCFSASEATSKNEISCKNTKGGIVTIWHAKEEQVDDLKEGAVYCVSNLSPLTGKGYAQKKNFVLHLRATNISDWQLLPHATFLGFTPRKVLPLSMLGTLPFRSEFDVAVLIIHVGKPYACGSQQRQWLFASDGSWEELSAKKCVSLLAIDLSTSGDAFLAVERALEGSVIGYCNLVKRCRDQKNSMWVAEASETSVFSSSLSSRNVRHLKAGADHVKIWARSSERLIAELEERVHKAVAGGT